MAFTVRGFFPLSVALFFALSFLLLPASAIPTANVASPVTNWALHRQGSHIPVLAGHGALAKRICYGDCRAVQVDANATTATASTSATPDMVNAPPSTGVPAAEPPDPDPDAGGAGSGAGAAASAEPASTLLSLSTPSSSTLLPPSSSPSVQPSTSLPSVSYSSSAPEEAQNRIGASTSGARAESSVALLPLVLLVASTVLYVL
ncbi:hypothetical protein EVG20_g9449 [Dentipellis fragilis]|uniref:Uncharacterized protein n=1 Tax=Dentipellis fragilis TaxID=205917 RepID=A0A4Y9Y030_9AGAM|nr:hypothetical protein EVG20_g9449 [Dentipellis fragilis]